MKTHSSAQYRVLVTGASGQLGSSLNAIQPQFPKLECQFIDQADLDLSNPQEIENFLNQHKFDLLINAAAYTAVDKAETEFPICDAVNHLAVEAMAKVAKQQSAKMIHVSTDYVFDGQTFQPYKESSPTAPQSVYGQTKLDGEKAFLAQMPTDGLILRTSWVYSEFGNNFVKTMLRLGGEREQLSIVFDQVGTPTYAGDLAKAIMEIVDSPSFWEDNLKTEIYNFSNEGVCSWYDFAKTIFDLSGLDCKTIPIEGKDYPTPASRPFYSVLNKQKIKKAYDLSIPYWRDSLIICLDLLSKEHK